MRGWIEQVRWEVLYPIALGFTILLLAALVESAWPGRASLGLWVVLIWLVPTASALRDDAARFQDRERWVRSELDVERARSTAAEERLATSQAHLAAAEAEAEELQQNLTQAAEDISRLEKELQKTRAAQRNRQSGNPLFRRVGLDPACPKWLAECARREYRRRLHPDVNPSHTAEATRRFQDAEATFDAIFALRKF